MLAVTGSDKIETRGILRLLLFVLQQFNQAVAGNIFINRCKLVHFFLFLAALAYSIFMCSLCGKDFMMAASISNFGD